MDVLLQYWTWLTDDRTAFASADVARDFFRCTTCRRVFMHYWACKPAGEPGRVGCRCGGKEARMVLIPEWHAAWLVLSRYVWRKLICGRTYWDPRFPARKAALDV